MSDFLSKKYRALGTVIELSLLRAEELASVEKLDQTYEKIVHYENLFTVHREHSELMTVNKAAGKKAVSLSQEVYSLTQKAVRVSQEHFGFNASIGPLAKLWHIGFADARVPSDLEIRAALCLINPDGISLDEQEKSIFLPEKGMSLDLGGIAKGYIADKIAEFWSEQGFYTGMINLGGNLRFLGNSMKRQWRVGVRNPLEKGKTPVLHVLTNSSSVVTSGIDQRYLEKEGKTYKNFV